MLYNFMEMYKMFQQVASHLSAESDGSDGNLMESFHRVLLKYISEQKLILQI